MDPNKLLNKAKGDLKNALGIGFNFKNLLKNIK